MTKLFYFLSGLIFLIGGYRIIQTESYEFRYYKALDLGIYSIPIGIMVLLLGLYFLYLTFNYKKRP